MRDYATVLAIPGDGVLEVSFPYDAEVVAIMRDLKGRWNPQRKCWSVKAETPEKSAELMGHLGAALLRLAPDAWKKRLDVIKALGCVTKGYEIFVGEGGMRLSVPAGHPCEHLLKQKGDDINFDRGKFYIKAATAMQSDVIEIIKRMMTEDLARYRTTMGETSGSALHGVIRSEVAGEIAEAGFLFGNKKFLERVDPHFGSARLPVATFAFKVNSRETMDDGSLQLEIEYPAIDEGYKALQALTKSGARILTDEDVEGKWQLKSRMW